MNAKDVAIAAKPTVGSSIYFAVGSPGNDPQLRLALTWARNIKGSHGPAVSVGSIGSFIAIYDGLQKLRTGQPQLDLPDTSASGPARGLPMHSLVIVGRRRPGTGGLVLSGQLGFGQTDTILDSAALDALGTASFVSVAEQKRYDISLMGWGIIANVNVLVLCGIGDGDPLDGLAQKLAERTQRRVYYNREPVTFQTDAAGGLSKVVVGAGGVAISGPSFADASVVPLTAGPSEFLPGAQTSVDPT